MLAFHIVYDIDFKVSDSRCKSNCFQAKQGRAACVILATAMLWMTEAMPLMITALIPAIMFPLVGIMDTKEVGSQVFYLEMKFFL